MPSNTTRLNKAERAAEGRKAREEAALKAKVQAMSNEELEEIAAPIVAVWEAAHGPVEPHDFAPDFAGLDSAAVDALLASLSDRDLVAWHKHDERMTAAKGAPVGNPCAEKGPPPL